MGSKAINLLKWAMRVNDWCIIGTKDRSTLDALGTLESHGLIVMNIERTKYRANIGD
jgi:hypothetical protein